MKLSLKFGKEDYGNKKVVKNDDGTESIIYPMTFDVEGFKLNIYRWMRSDDGKNASDEDFIRMLNAYCKFWALSSCKIKTYPMEAV
jgi:hypothetical protein